MTEAEPLPSSEPTRPRARWWMLLLAAVAIAAVAFAIGRFSVFGIAEQTPGDDSAEAGFARDMQQHHAQAVEMAMIIYPKTRDAELRALAYDIATTQSAQRGEMYGWLVQWGLPQGGTPLMAWMMDADPGSHEAMMSSDGDDAMMGTMTDADAREAMGMATAEELSALTAASGTAADCQFLSLMTEHHRGAIEMVDAVLAAASDPEVLRVAEAMASTQQFEIDAMASMQQRMSCS